MGEPSVAAERDEVEVAFVLDSLEAEGGSGSHFRAIGPLTRDEAACEWGTRYPRTRIRVPRSSRLYRDERVFA